MNCLIVNASKLARYNEISELLQIGDKDSIQQIESYLNSEKLGDLALRVNQLHDTKNGSSTEIVEQLLLIIKASLLS